MFGAEDKDPQTLSELKSMLSGVGPQGGKLVTTAPAATKPLRYTFNHSLRKHRLEAQLEDVTDDEAAEEEDADIADASHHEGAGGVAASGGAGGPDGDAEAEPEQAGVTKAADKPLPKRLMSSRTHEWLSRDAAGTKPGLYDSDPALKNPAREVSHRKGKKKRGSKPDDGRYHFWQDGT